jgi:carboxypeptidase C (cathepsin A)
MTDRSPLRPVVLCLALGLPALAPAAAHDPPEEGAEALRRAMHENPYLQVLVMSGYYDLATPYFASDYTVTHMSLDEAVRDNVRAAYFEAGHMMYVREESLAKFRQEYLRLIQDALAPRSAGPATAGAAR